MYIHHRYLRLLGPKDAPNFLPIESTLKAVDEGLDQAKKGDKRNIDVVESDDEDDEAKKRLCVQKSLPDAASGRTLNIFNDSCTDINEYSVPVCWGVEQEASSDSVFPGKPVIWVQMAEEGPKEHLLLIGIHLVSLPQAVYADFKFGVKKAILAVRYVRPSHKVDDQTKGSARSILESMKTVDKRKDATFRNSYTAIMLLPAKAYKCSLENAPYICRHTTIGKISAVCSDNEIPRFQARSALKCGGKRQPFSVNLSVTPHKYLEPVEGAYSFMDNETFDIALFSTFVHGEVILPEDVGTGDTYDHVLDNFPVYLRTEDLNVHRKRWGKSKGVLFRNQAYDDEDHEHHGEVAIAMSNFVCAFGTGVGVWTMDKMNAFISELPDEQIAPVFKKACMRISKFMRKTGWLLWKTDELEGELHYDVPADVKPFLAVLTGTVSPPSSIDDKDEGMADVSSEDNEEEDLEPIVPTIDDVVPEHNGVNYQRITRWRHLPSPLRKQLGEDDSDFESIISTDDDMEASMNSDMEDIGIYNKGWWRKMCRKRGRKYEELKKKRREVWEKRRLYHVRRYVGKMKALIPHYAATFIKPKDLEKQDLSDDDVWSPTSDFEVNYVMRSRRKYERLEAAERAARDTAAAVAVGPTEAMEEALSVVGGATDSRGSDAPTVVTD